MWFIVIYLSHFGSIVAECNIIWFHSATSIMRMRGHLDDLSHILHEMYSGLQTSCTLKGEIRNRFNIISEERVKFSEQNSENLMKIGWKIRKLWHFEVSQIFTKHFLTGRYEYANERVDDVIASLFIYFVHKFLKNSIFCPNLW